jgi:hypothetical protein
MEQPYRGTQTEQQTTRQPTDRRRMASLPCCTDRTLARRSLTERMCSPVWHAALAKPCPVRWSSASDCTERQRRLFPCCSERPSRRLDDAATSKKKEARGQRKRHHKFRATRGSPAKGRGDGSMRDRPAPVVRQQRCNDRCSNPFCALRASERGAFKRGTRHAAAPCRVLPPRRRRGLMLKLPTILKSIDQH